MAHAVECQKLGMLRQTYVFSWGCAWALVLVLAACSNDGNSADKKPLKDLSSEETSALCNDIAEDINSVDLTRYNCLVSWEVFQIIYPDKTCDDHVNKCVAEHGGDGGPQGDDKFQCTKSFGARAKACDASVTVGDLKVCVAKWKSVLEENASATCENPPSELRLDFGEPPDVAECDEITRCFQDDRDGGISRHDTDAFVTDVDGSVSDDGGE